ATNLRVRSLRDFALVAVITDRAENVRAYAEQITPLTNAPLVAAVSYSAAPLAAPYADTFADGLLVGYSDAYTYSQLLGSVPARRLSQQIRIVPTDTPTPPPTQPAIAVTREATVEPTPDETAAPALTYATVSSNQAVNMRSGPGTDNPVITAVQPGERVIVLGYN